ncbi:CoA transferase [Alkalilimnicola ehrlichii]|uniref:CoA transferase n=1 Tax=Alkalilimnicola ehrlichii TaxID=351052 RepID=A0A3E0X517_9GAMM|nr:CaiB/BaiF CoA-transferase family protein [Alkalilimnicola ehrlichii]RFA31499.1 CoA transferase [Alkalilimnicola ehrlichii]RFA39626.1 CoA transferase [Alkalilimnicola ehrlichii]
MSGVLNGIRVLDLSRILAGPWAGQLLADLGAEVIKVERPERGDDTRSWGPPFVDEGEAAYYHGCNRGKQSVAIDIATEQGQSLVRRLAGECDIVLENFKVGTLSRYGLGYEQLRQDYPGLIYCSITGFGQSGPYRDRAGYDLLIQALGGMMSVTGQPDGSPGSEPMKVGVAITDVFTGMYAAVAVLGALRHRDATGAGQHIDLALLDVQVATLANQAMNYLVSGQVPRRLGNAHPNIVPYQAFPAADGHLILAVGNDDQFRRFCQVAGCPELAEDERYARNADRVARRDELIPQLEEVFQQRPRAAWLSDLEAVGVPCGPINDLSEVFADPQVQARGLQQTQRRADGRSVPGVANPIRYSATPIQADSAAPTLGEHTQSTLQRLLKLDEAALDRLEQAGVIQVQRRPDSSD